MPLQPKHLAIVRAALTFWDEEMATAVKAVYRHYLHSKDQEAIITPADVAAARLYFHEVKSKFGLLDVQAGEIVSNPLAEESRDLFADHEQRIVSVLIR